MKSVIGSVFKNKKTRSFFVITIVVILFLEVFLFNFNAFHLVGRDYEKSPLSLTGTVLSGFYTNADGSITSDSSTARLEINEIDRRIGTIYLDMDISGAAEIKSNFYFSDESSKSLRDTGASITVINGNEQSKTTAVQLSGKVDTLLFYFNLPENCEITIHNVEINRPIAFRFSFFRVFLILFLVFLVYALIKFPSMKKKYSEKSYLAKRIMAVITVLFCIIPLFFALSYLYPASFDAAFKSTSGNQMTQELVDAFEAGQVHLLEEPTPELLALDNPYDWSERISADVHALWDHCLYNGKYYSYYGIAPILFLFLPYHLITGYYFSSNLAVMLFSIIGIIFLAKLYMAIIERKFKMLQINHVIMGLVMLIAACGIWFCCARPLFYEIAISAGFACVAAGIYFLITSNILSERKTSFVRLGASTTLLALAVLSRPTTTIYCAAALIPLFFGFKKLWNNRKNHSPKTFVRYLVAAILPFAFWGGIQMIYNYLRFDSFFDFGIQYSLTINDFTRSEFHFIFVIVGLYACLFTSPVFKPEFPFFFSNFERFNMNGYYFIDEFSYAKSLSIGIIFRALPIFGYIFAPRALKYTKYPKRNLLIYGSFCVLAPLVIIFSIWESGFAVRYEADFSWQIILGALLVIFVVLRHFKDNAGVNYAATLLLTATTLLCVFINFAQVYNFFVLSNLTMESKQAVFAFERLFEFWK